MDFKLLWDNHPANRVADDEYPCVGYNGQPNYENQCAIKMGVCLERCNFDMSKFEGVKCWHHPRSDNHILRVEELRLFFAKVLPNKSLTIKRKRPNKDISVEDFEGKSGIVIFCDFWGDNNQGDHVDLFNGEELADGDLDYFERSERVYLWEID